MNSCTGLEVSTGDAIGGGANSLQRPADAAAGLPAPPAYFSNVTNWPARSGSSYTLTSLRSTLDLAMPHVDPAPGPSVGWAPASAALP